MNLLPDGYPPMLAIRHIQLAEDTAYTIAHMGRPAKDRPCAVDMRVANETDSELSYHSQAQIDADCANAILQHALDYLCIGAPYSVMDVLTYSASDYHTRLICADCANAILADVPRLGGSNAS